MTSPTPRSAMVTAGIDLSADPKKTGVATIAWMEDGATVTAVEVGKHSDADLAELIQRVDKSGIDCPLGWPIAFVDYLIAHRAGGQDLIVPPTRHPLTNRATDLHLRQAVRLQPLSVSADRIGAAAMRCAAILSGLTREGVEVDRTGRSGPVVEVYPAAALKLWGLPHQGYKGRDPANARRRAELVQLLVGALPWLDLGEYADDCAESDDALDSVLCAAIAGLSLRGQTAEIPAEHLAAATVEGWIALPAQP
jgi:predicted nuclease with RNAse H fold